MAEARLIEVLGSLSLATDAADGFAPETTIRTALLAGALAADVGDDFLVADALYGALIRHLGCTGFAVEEARRYGAGDDVALRRTLAMVDFSDPPAAMARIQTGIGAEAAPADRDAAIGNLLGDGPVAVAAHDAAQCDAATRLAALLPVSSGARTVAEDAFERWDGNGGPAGKAGAEVSLVARIVEVAYVAELHRSRAGADAAVDALERRRAGQLDPGLVDRFLAGAADLFDAIEDPTVPLWDRLLDAEPAPVERLRPEQLGTAAVAFGRFADLKSSFFTGHAEAVAHLASTAVDAAGHDAALIADARIAGLVHDVGIVGIPTGTWELPRPFSAAERDRARLHAWETQRIIGSTPLFARVAAIAGGAHERCDGGGYHRGLGAAGLDPVSRILAVADVAVALGSDRPHRPALGTSEVDAHLQAEAAEGRLDRSAVTAVREVLGYTAPLAAPPIHGLTERESQVLGLVATGASNKEIAATLGITAKTVAHHVAHVYAKVGCRSRAGATLVALEHGLVPAPRPPSVG